MDGIATLWPEQMTKCMVIEKNKQTKKQTKQTTNTYTKNPSIRNELSPVSVPWLNPPRRASR